MKKLTKTQLYEKYRKIAGTQAKMVKSIIASIPDGFKLHSVVDGYFSEIKDISPQVDEWGKDCKSVFIENHDQTIQFAINVEKKQEALGFCEKRYGKAVTATGHTHFFDPTQNCMVSFDAYGVSDSFYIRSPYTRHIQEDVVDIKQVLLEQVEKIRERLELSKSMVRVPTIPFRVHKDSIQKMTDNLLKGNTESFHPSGFGTGYAFNIKSFGRYSKRADAELCKFFNVPQLYYETIECD